MIDIEKRVENALETSAEVVKKMVDVANVQAVFGTPIERDGRVVIPCCEVSVGGGVGIGSGGPSRAGEESERAVSVGWGAGSGGGSSARPIALIVMSPEGVEVKPIIDATKVGLVALTTLAFILSWLVRLGGRRRNKKGPSFAQLKKLSAQ